MDGRSEMPYRMGRGRSKYPPHDRRNRSRPHTMIFRVTPRQQQELKCREFLCGRTIQDYMLQSAMTQQVIVAGDRALLERVERVGNRLLGSHRDHAAIFAAFEITTVRTVLQETVEHRRLAARHVEQARAQPHRAT